MALIFFLVVIEKTWMPPRSHPDPLSESLVPGMRIAVQTLPHSVSRVMNVKSWLSDIELRTIFFTYTLIKDNP